MPSKWKVEFCHVCFFIGNRCFEIIGQPHKKTAQNVWFWCYFCVVLSSKPTYSSRQRHSEIFAKCCGLVSCGDILYRINIRFWKGVEHSGLEPLTSTLPVLRSTRWASAPCTMVCACKINTNYWICKYKARIIAFFSCFFSCVVFWVGSLLAVAVIFFRLRVGEACNLAH